VKVCSNPNVYLGGNISGASPVKWLKDHPDGLVVDLGYTTQLDVASNYGFHLPTSSRVLQVHWPDYGTCDLVAEDWNALGAEIHDQKEVLILCQGGHGRTGSAAAIVLTMLSKCKGEEAVKFVREVYCKRAVESKEQLTYLDGLLGTQTERTLAYTPFSGGRIVNGKYESGVGTGSSTLFHDHRTPEERAEYETWVNEFYEGRT